MITSLRMDSFQNALWAQILLTFKAIKLIFLVMSLTVLECVDFIDGLKQMRMHKLGLMMIIATFLAKIKILG